MAPRQQNSTCVAYPLRNSEGEIEGWFKFPDGYLNPQILYANYPPTTTIQIGGRLIQIDRAVPTKIRLLEPDEDCYFWCSRKQHVDRVSLGEYHRDFGDVEVAFSFSTPQTHIWFAGYSIHTDAFENLSFTSYNATVRVRPEHVLQNAGRVVYPHGSEGAPDLQLPTVGSQEAVKAEHRMLRSRKKGKGVFIYDGPEEAEEFGGGTRGALLEASLKHKRHVPLYSAQVPMRHEGNLGKPVVEYHETSQHLNDCERSILQRDAYDCGVGISAFSHPVSVPPVYPGISPFAVPQLIHSVKNAETRGLNRLSKRAKRKLLLQAKLMGGAALDEMAAKIPVHNPVPTPEDLQLIEEPEVEKSFDLAGTVQDMTERAAVVRGAWDRLSKCNKPFVTHPVTPPRERVAVLERVLPESVGIAYGSTRSASQPDYTRARLARSTPSRSERRQVTVRPMPALPAPQLLSYPLSHSHPAGKALLEAVPQGRTPRSVRIRPAPQESLVAPRRPSAQLRHLEHCERCGGYTDSPPRSRDDLPRRVLFPSRVAEEFSPSYSYRTTRSRTPTAVEDYLDDDAIPPFPRPPRRPRLPATTFPVCAGVRVQ